MGRKRAPAPIEEDLIFVDRAELQALNELLLACSHALEVLERTRAIRVIVMGSSSGAGDILLALASILLGLLVFLASIVALSHVAARLDEGDDEG